MTLDELIKKYPNKKDSDAAMAKMSRAEAKELIDSMSTPQGKSRAKKEWERLSGKKY